MTRKENIERVQGVVTKRLAKHKMISATKKALFDQYGETINKHVKWIVDDVLKEDPDMEDNKIAALFIGSILYSDEHSTKAFEMFKQFTDEKN